MGKFLGLSGFVFILILFFFTVPTTVQAASLVNASDQLSTSRPSAASYLTSPGSASGDTFVPIANNGSRYLASDSARILRTSTGGTIVSGKTVASQSAALTTVNLTSTLGTAAQAGTDVLVAAQTAVHKVRFTTPTGIGTSTGKIIITFPSLAAADTNTASPSASTFMFNQLTTANASSNIYVYDVTTNATYSGCSTWTVTAPSITCNLNVALAPNETLIFFIGCTAANNNAAGNSCTASIPTLLNPTSSVGQVSGNVTTANTWQVSITTQDSSSITQDSASVRIGTNASVQVQAQVDPTITFTIAGSTNSAVINTLIPGCGANTDTVNNGIDTNSVFVNLGILSNGSISKAAQILTVSTNSANGYSITATSSGRLINPATGFSLTDTGALTQNDTPIPALFPASGNTNFGIHACGYDTIGVNSDQWSSSAATDFAGAGGKIAKYANPWNSGAGSFADTLATYSGGPASARQTVVEYGATVAGTTPAGIYTTVLTYIATATF